MSRAVATLRPIVRALGGLLYDGGLRASVPAPGHSPGDRSVSLRLSGGRVLVHSFGAADWREVLDDLRARGLVDREARLAGWSGVGGAAPAAPAGGAREAAAAALWAAAGPLKPGTAAWAYVRRRAIRRDLAGAAALGSHPAAPLAVYRPGGGGLPALLAAVRAPDGRLCAAEVTYLTPAGRRAERLRLPRKTVGRLPPGAAVRLDPAGPELLVAEGVFTALSAAERFGLPAWSLLSAGAMARWSPPAGVRRLVIAGDRGRAGEAAAAALAARAAAAGVRVEVRLPPPGCGDWNDLAVLEGEEGTGGAAGARGRAPAAGPETEP